MVIDQQLQVVRKLDGFVNLFRELLLEAGLGESMILFTSDARRSIF
ncbi:MAG: hypothetical protein JW841_09030 [Deltaproteobacteria bacterium]|nr:hypothetical protein [Deltaproteobacteria bacterium]